MQDQNIPIDIQTSKLLDWLINRRHCDKNWPQQVQNVREKINAAIQDMPEHPGITRLLTGTYINYFHCLQIVEILKETEADSKSLFGRYGSQRMKDWQEVVRCYETGSVGLAEAAQLLMRNTAYEIPATKKAIVKCEQVQHDCDRKEAECAKNAQDFRDKYASSCRQIGIDGQDIRKEIVKLLASLPESYRRISKQAVTVSEACEYYRTFVQRFTSSDEDCVPVLRFIIDKGNTTVYEWRYGEAPLTVEEPPLLIDVDTEPTADDDVIDFGALDLGGEIELETGDIDWGQIDLMPEAQETGAVLDLDVGVSLDGIEVQEAGLAGGVARETEALTLLDYHKTRNIFIDDLLEVEAFLRQRLVQVRASAQSSGGVTQSLVDSDADVSEDQLEAMIRAVDSVLNAINSVQLKNLALIRESPSYVDRLTNSLQQHLALADKMVANGKTAAAKRDAAAAEQRRLQPLLQRLVQRTKELQTDMEKHISRKYHMRPVHITGATATL